MLVLKLILIIIQKESTRNTVASKVNYRLNIIKLYLLTFLSVLLVSLDSVCSKACNIFDIENICVILICPVAKLFQLAKKFFLLIAEGDVFNQNQLFYLELLTIPPTLVRLATHCGEVRKLIA